MNIALVSEDPIIHGLCREVLRENHEWNLTVVPRGHCPPDADLYIWDDHGRISRPIEVGRATARHLFLLHPGELEPEARVADGIFTAEVLLKPLTRTGLAAVLKEVTNAVQEEFQNGSLRRHNPEEVIRSLIRSNIHIQQHDDERTNFLARAAHDFRAPL